MKLVDIHQRVFIHFRRRRMRRFYAIFEPTSTTRLLDIGGAPNTWMSESRDRARFPVTMVNLRYPDPAARANGRFTLVEGDALDLPFEDGSFDIAFSNSVIEHMTTWERQKAFACEARRVAGRLWIQTPARSFPLEPHVLAPFFQFLPGSLQRRLARNFTLWGLMTRPDKAGIEEMLGDIRLLTYREMQALFPDCRILKERVLGLTKSYIAVRDSASASELVKETRSARAW
jgi:SAM-dependent methyltransferase